MLAGEEGMVKILKCRNYSKIGDEDDSLIAHVGS